MGAAEVPGRECSAGLWKGVDTAETVIGVVVCEEEEDPYTLRCGWDIKGHAVWKHGLSYHLYLSLVNWVLQPGDKRGRSWLKR
jgi:hypothetical protein